LGSLISKSTPQAIHLEPSKPLSNDNAQSTSHDNQHPLPESTADTSSYNTKDGRSSRLWEKALHEMTQDKGKRKLLDDYKKAVALKVTGRNLAASGSPGCDITVEETTKWLRSVGKEITENSNGRELVSSTAEAISSIANILSSAGAANPYVGLACAGVCILTLVNS